MEFHVIAASAIRGANIYKDTKLKETFLNVSSQENALLYYCILIVKCLTVAYGMKKISAAATFLMLLVNFIKTCICEIGFNGMLFSLLHFLGVTGTLPVFYDQDFYSIPNGLILMIACQYRSFEFFVDVYLAVLFFAYVFELFDKEIDKCITLICYLYCLDWFTDYLLVGKNVGMMHAALVLHTPIFLLTAFIPLNSRSIYGFLYLAVGITLWQIYRLAEAGIKYGITSNRFFILDETLVGINESIDELRNGSLFYEL